MNSIFANAEKILSYPPAVANEKLGESEEARSIFGEKIGSGPIRISLIAGCHADEPLGPRFLSHFLSYLRDKKEELGKQFTWWIVPNANPDGAEANKNWNSSEEFLLKDYLLYSVRDLPGKDLEFNFPRSDTDLSTRPESRAIYKWWRQDASPFSLHASLHGMSFAFGPWFLIDKHWKNTTKELQARCAEASHSLGYELHDSQRFGEKGFSRISEGFATTPSHKAMSAFFLEKGEKQMAAKFHPSSMDCIQSFNKHISKSEQKALCLVSEMPLFLLPNASSSKPEDKQELFDLWRLKITKIKQHLRDSRPLESDEIFSKVSSMPPKHHMALIWELIRAGIETITDYQEKE